MASQVHDGVTFPNGTRQLPLGQAVRFLIWQGLGTETVDVPVTTPRDLLREHLPRGAGSTIDYVNIDVEGEELPVLRAWPVTCLKHKPAAAAAC